MDYNINFPHLHIYLDHVGKNIMIGNFSIAYYGIVIAIGMLAGLGIACWMAKRTGQSSDTYFDLALVAIVCSVIGARIYYVVFRWDLYKDNLLNIFNLRQGGLAIYGGVIAAIITTFIFARVKSFRWACFLTLQDWDWCLDRLLDAGAISLTEKRLADIRTGFLPCSCRCQRCVIRM